MSATAGVIPLSSVISVQVQFTSSGIPGYNVNNIALFTTDSFLSNPNNDLFRFYITAQEVGTDFGTNTETYLQALNIFAQQPNILNGNGQLIIIPIQSGAITGINASPTAAGTGYHVGDILTITGNSGFLGTVHVDSVGGSGDVTAATLVLPGFGYSTGAGATTSGGFGTGCTINITSVGTETLKDAYIRGNTYNYFNGILATDYGASNTWSDLAAAVQANGNQILFLPSSLIADITGEFTNIKNATQINTRCLYYGASAQDARLFAAAYAGKGLSTNWGGSGTTITMNLQQLINVLPDATLTTTLLNYLSTAGVDCYGNYGGAYPGVVCVGANKYFDEISNLVWLVTSLQVAGFNALATVGTKIPQTESGMSLLKASYRLVVAQAVSNGYLAPGRWTGADTFGDQTKFLANIAQFGFYIFSAPVSEQSSSQREARQAPLVQIACKEAGAIQSSDVLITINQ